MYGRAEAPHQRKGLKKATLIYGPRAVVEQLKDLKCDGSHEHHPIEGGYRMESGKWAALSEYAGGYPKELCERLVRGSEDFLEASNGVYMWKTKSWNPSRVCQNQWMEMKLSTKKSSWQTRTKTSWSQATRRKAWMDEERRPVSKEVRESGGIRSPPTWTPLEVHDAEND